MRFGLFVPQGWRHDLVTIDPAQQWATMNAIAAHADAGPWDSIWVYDHFHTVPIPSEEATHEAWSLMAAFAATTSRVKLGQMCTCISYRNPAYLAKLASTVDLISGGRAQMGIGAGWYEHEWRAYGYGFPRAGERLGRLREGVEIMRQAWSTGSATLDGEYYQVDGAIVRPLPLQPSIPMWIAGGGEKVTLRIAAEYADATNFAGGDLDEFIAKSALLEAHCAEVGTDFGRITRSENFNVVIGETEADVAARVDAIEARVAPFLGRHTAGFIATYRDGTALTGTPEQIVQRLQQHRAAGLSYTIGYFPEAAYDLSGVELFEREVIPALV
ncbi:LLM class F420-dependent oxidoreductase [Leifsonia sp. H3M29-4]|uniref:LLM class F420-dependent oxidoreductase n=1 Tax=Salinibacterium metalliresistens TaxID=3031321 RepID=UPI0023DB45A7|nr:LLM class F420-dependent oxidoreductase [Salinibacterium metalliresistens]MDF1479558.1 LLM class F420-dependent oxidoreductase [Salinibacterium metalliresistens]